MAEFVKLKNVKRFPTPWSQGDKVRMTGTLVLRHSSFFGAPYEVEHDVWSIFEDSFRFFKYRSDGKFVERDLSFQIEMAEAFGEVEYAS